MPEENVTIRLTPDQALVLSDWLHKVIGTPAFDAFVNQDRAVWSPLYKLSGTLETTLPEIFAPTYTARLEAARERLQDTLGEVGRPTDAMTEPTGPDVE